MAATLDHLVYAVPDLGEATAFVADALGVRPSAGGHHVGAGTANTLLGLGGATYLEIIGPDLAQPPPRGPRPFGIDDLIAPALVTWAARVDDLDAAVARARAAGYDPGEGRAMERATPDGSLLRWRLTAPPMHLGGVVPFLIDWGASPHPSATAAGGAGLGSFTLRTPDADRVRAVLAALECDVAVDEAPVTGLEAVLTGPRGRLTLRG